MLLLLWFHLLWNPLRGGRQILARLFSGRPSAPLCRKTVDKGNSNNSFISWTITQLLGNLNSFSFYSLKNQRCSHHHCVVCGSWIQRLSDDVTVDCWTDIPTGLGTPGFSVCNTIWPMAEGGLSLLTEAVLALRTSQICSCEHLLIRGSHQASTGILHLLWLIWARSSPEPPFISVKWLSCSRCPEYTFPMCLVH